MKQSKPITAADLYAAERITAEMAAAYLGGGLGPQSCRLLARDGKIGCAVPGTNRVYFQAAKLVEFKEGRADEKYRAAARAFREEGLSDIATKVAVAMLRVIEESAETIQATDNR